MVYINLEQPGINNFELMGRRNSTTAIDTTVAYLYWNNFVGVSHLRRILSGQNAGELLPPPVATLPTNDQFWFTDLDFFPHPSHACFCNLWE